MEKMDVESTKPEKMDTDSKSEKMFTLKKWNAVAMWSWDVECDTCAICRVQVMEQLALYCILHSKICQFIHREDSTHQYFPRMWARVPEFL
ncbi:RING-box protein 2-like isoform X2 [Diaphorina citri]|uniref:RING-box protein 2-like isoform X2 n=1 Tax=Diaphorina citri TaxID=121845 RepID=A0A1S3DAQ9_DIACI|nr:RING-box protein 2-like isoform X2 [Diaphorina citri]